MEQEIRDVEKALQSEPRFLQTPSVGRIVHYWSDVRANPLAAIITAVHGDTVVNLCVFDFDGRITPRTSVPFVRKHETRSGVWSWPEYVPARQQSRLEVPAAMARELTTHHDGHGLTESIRIEADAPGPGGASHEYIISVAMPEDRTRHWFLQFQRGPRNDHDSTHGIVERVLTAVLIDRLTSFQAGEYACPENAEALSHLHAAHRCFKQRADSRAERGVLGTNKV